MAACDGSALQAFRTADVGWDLIVNKHVFVEEVLPGAIQRQLSEEEMDHYRAPFVDRISRKPLWRWPNEIPIDGQPEDVVRIVEEYGNWLQRSRMPKLLMYATPGSLLRRQMVVWCSANLPNLTVADLGSGLHFVQEDHPHEIGDHSGDGTKGFLTDG